MINAAAGLAATHTTVACLPEGSCDDYSQQQLIVHHQDGPTPRLLPPSRFAWPVLPKARQRQSFARRPLRSIGKRTEKLTARQENPDMEWAGSWTERERPFRSSPPCIASVAKPTAGGSESGGWMDHGAPTFISVVR
jgi:hypothetical protein